MTNYVSVKSCLVAACVSLATIACARPYVIEVKPGGSLEAARDAARALSASDRAKGVEIVLAPGVYRIGSTLKLGSQDSGVKWRSGSGRAVICDGMELRPEQFKPVPEGTPRIDPDARAKVLVADLSAANVWLGDVPKREFRAPMPIPELFVDGVRMTAARWPNEGWATVAKFIDQGTKNNDGSVGDSLNGKKTQVQPRGGTFGYEGDRPSRWTKAPYLWLHGFWCFDWYDAVTPVAYVNTASNSITFAAQHTYGVRAGNPSPRRWRAVHLLEELDAPGEYYADRDAKKLYLYPPASFGSGSRIVLTHTWRHLVSIEKGTNIVFRGIDFTECQGDAVMLKNCERVAIEKCRFSNIRCKAIVANDCRGCRVSTCDISYTGAGGIVLGGGDRKTLTPGKNLVEDCLIRDFSVHCLTYASAIALNGCGNVARHNELSSAPHMAVGVSGNDHVFEYNVVSNVCMSSDDASAFYKGRNPSCRGNILRYNFWSEIGSPRGHGNAAVYFDDGDGGDFVIGNVFYRCGEPGFGNFGTVFCHGGYSNVVDNCIFVECRRPLGSSPWAQKRWGEFLQSPLEQGRLTKEVDIRQPPYTTKYPELIGYFDPQPDEIRWNAAFNSAFVNCPASLPGRKPGEKRPGIISGRWYTNSTDVVFDHDPGFRDMRRKDFRLADDAELYRKIPGFKPIPFEKIGLLTPRQRKQAPRQAKQAPRQEKQGNGMPDAARPEVAAVVSAAAAKPHPRLFADAAGFEKLKDRIGKDELLKAGAEHVRAVADMIVPLPLSERIKQGKRLLAVSRTALYRIATLAMAYRLYGDKAHLDRAVAEMRAACAFEDWNPSHFLDVGEMSLAVAVGYDWLYADLDEATRKEIAAGLRRCGLDASRMKAWWIRAHNNWGQVCHAGILAAALALAEENPADAARYVQRCIDMLPISMKALAPNGNYPEGPGYWSYGMHFNVIAIALLEGTLGSDFGLASMPGFREAGNYPDIVTGPSGLTFNYADGGSGRNTHPALWWFAKRFKAPDILSYRELGNFKAYAARPIQMAAPPPNSSRRGKSLAGGHRLFPFALFWLEAPPASGAPSSLPLVWDGKGPVPITIQRSSWNDDEALFVGLKGGSPSGPHGHMDGGSFVMDTKGVRWAVDLGAESYYGIESRGMNLWSSAQDSDRWRVFRLNTWSHNVPMIDGCQQLVKGTAKVMEVKREGASSEVTLDLSSLYTNATSVVRKGAMASDGRRYLLRDTFAGVRPGAQIRWAMMTCAEPAVDGDKVTLRQNGKTLTLAQCGAQKGEWKIGDGQGPNEWDSKNSGCRQLLFTVPATAEGTADIAVKFSF